jgi:hypothetical protein
MVLAAFIVALDANVLFPPTLRDTVLRAAAVGNYQLRWSVEILDEMERNLVAKFWRECAGFGFDGMPGCT